MGLHTNVLPLTITSECMGMEPRCDNMPTKLERQFNRSLDHNLDDPAQTQINAFSGRGILVESARGPVCEFSPIRCHIYTH